MASITRDELYNIFKQSKPFHNKPPDFEIALKIISEKLCVAEDPALKRDVQLLLWGYAKHMKKQRSLTANTRTNVNMSEVLLQKEHYTPLSSTNIESSAPPTPKKRKSFTDLSRQMQHIRTDKILQDLKDFINNENKENDSECKLTLTQILGFLIYRINYTNNRKIADLGKSIFEENVIEGASFDNLDAIALMHDLTLTKSQMRNVKSYLGQKMFTFLIQMSYLMLVNY